MAVTAVMPTFAQDMTVSEIISRHLKSLGPASAIAESKNRMAVGTTDFVIVQTAKHSSGGAMLASNGTNMAVFSTFNIREYRMERIGLFDDKVNIPIVYEGKRSPLGSFLAAYDKTLSGHIFGGSIFSSWALLSDLANGRLELDGKKKVGDRDAFVLKYSPKGGLGAGSYIKLYFDAENFRHLRTVYRQGETDRGFYENSGGDPGFAKGSNGSPVGSWNQDMASNGSTLTEDFSDFKKDAAGIMLPHSYSLHLSIDSVRGTGQWQWDFKISEYKLIKEFPAGFWTFTASAQG